MKRGLFHTATLISLLLAILVTWVWFKSFDREFHHASVLKSDGRFTFRSRWGQLVWFGPPQGVEDMWGAQLAKEMNNGDFDWRAIRPGYMEGIGRPQSPTWRMYGQYREWMIANNRDAAPIRAWLAGLEDEARFLPSHFMLLHAAEEKRKAYFRLSYPWREGAFRTMPATRPFEADSTMPEMRVDPVLYITAAPSGATPDLSQRQRLRQEWHDVLDTPRWKVFHGWIVLALLALPLAWVARPRWEHKTLGRWAMNFAALASFVVCIASAAMAVRSYSVDEQWVFSAHPSTATSKWNYPMQHQGWIGSSRGMLISRTADVPEASWVGVRTMTWGYQEQVSPGPTLPANLKFAPSGERKLNFPGLAFHALPPQVITVTYPARLLQVQGAPPGTGIAIPPSTSTTLLGFESLLVSWWLMVAVSSLTPAIWMWGAGVHLARMRKARKLATQICLKCGYDMRATPTRCPECGNEPAQV